MRAITRNPSRAHRVIQFINLLPIVDGPAVGQRFVVDPWLEAWIRNIYEPEYDDGTRVVRRAALSVARKNNKSYGVAGLLLAHLVGPEALPNGQIFSAAIDRMQAKVIFDMCRKMIEVTPSLSKVLKVIPSTSTIMVKRSDVRGRGSVYRALSAEVSSKHGLGASFFVYDELGEARNDELWNVLLDSQQAVQSPLAVAISTQNNDPQHPLSQMIDDGLRGEDPTIVCHLHAADEDCALDDEAQWIKANPTLLSWKKKEPIAAAAREAIRLPAKEANFRRRYLNQRVSPNASLIAQADWKACRKDDIEFLPHRNDPQTGKMVYGERVWLALDMSRRVDLTALVMISADGEKTKVACWFWKPEDHIEDHTRRDRVPYDVYARKPEDGSEPKLLVSPGRSIAPKAVVTQIANLCSQFEVLGLVYDRWGMDELLRHFDEIGLSAQEGDGYGLRLMPWGQGFKDMSPAVTAFEDAVINKALEHPNHPLLNWNVANAQVTGDGADGRKLDKEKSRTRIDGAVALAMALGAKARERGEVAAINPWADPDFKFTAIEVR